MALRKRNTFPPRGWANHRSFNMMHSGVGAGRTPPFRVSLVAAVTESGNPCAASSDEWSYTGFELQM